MTGLAIASTGLTKQFRGHRAVDQVSLAVPPGSVYGFLGPNGSGKPNPGNRHFLCSGLRLS